MVSTAILLICLGSLTVRAADLLSDFCPSTHRSDYGTVSSFPKQVDDT
jgi:hypothetical protein